MSSQHHSDLPEENKKKIQCHDDDKKHEHHMSENCYYTIEHHHHCCCREHHKDDCCKHDGNNGNGGDNPNRPGKTTGTNRGTLNDPSGLTIGDLTTNYPPNSWGGNRKDYPTPFLFMRENPGDTGTRLNPDGTRMSGVFWESPDIIILAGVDPAAAPAIPPKNNLGDTALANEPNTIYAHIWNFGLGPAMDVIVEFYWVDPSLGVTFSNAQKISTEYGRITIGTKQSGNCHTVVKCSVPWAPKFLNGGHECLLVRVQSYPDDMCSTISPFDASIERRIGQRNIHVINTPGVIPMGAHILKPKLLQIPVTLKVGPLFGASAKVNVLRIAPNNMPWLQMRTGVRGKFPQQALATGNIALSRPVQIGAGLPTTGAADQHIVTGDDQQVAFTTTDKMPSAGQSHVYRITASQGTQIFGGYTVVLLGN